MSLVLNFSPITFDDREISAGRLPYGADGKEVLERLRSEHWATHVFRRDGEHGILAVPETVNTHPSMLLLPLPPTSALANVT